MHPQRPSAPTVSVLMTLYNKGPYVEEAVRSVLASTYRDFELLVVDDASTDDGAARVRAISDPRLRLLESDANAGRPSAANRGYDAARGRYVAVLDADDRMLPERLAKQVAFLDAHPEVGALGSWLLQFGAREQVHRFPEADGTARAITPFGMPVSYGTCMFRRAVLEEHGLRCPANWLTPGMDYLFMLDVGYHTQYANLQEVLTEYRIGEQNMRHGRDPHRDMPPLVAEMFRRMGLRVNAREVDLHLHLYDPPHPRLGVRGVLALHRWKRRLINDTRSRFPGPYLEQEVERRWDRIFHDLVRREPAAALVHNLLSGADRQRYGYWAAFQWRRLRGQPLEPSGGAQ